MLYRPYTGADFEPLYHLEQSCFAPRDRFPRRYMRQLVEAPMTATWLACDVDVLVGFSIVEWTAEPAGLAAYLQTIEVAPAWRGRHIASELLRRAEFSARTAGAAFLRLHVEHTNAGAIALYEARGYAPAGHSQNYYGPARHARIYVRSLAVPLSAVPPSETGLE